MIVSFITITLVDINFDFIPVFPYANIIPVRHTVFTTKKDNISV